MDPICEHCANRFPHASEFLLLENIFHCCFSISISGTHRGCNSRASSGIGCTINSLFTMPYRIFACISQRTLLKRSMKSLFALGSICIQHQVSRSVPVSSSE